MIYERLYLDKPTFAVLQQMEVQTGIKKYIIAQWILRTYPVFKASDKWHLHETTDEPRSIAAPNNNQALARGAIMAFKAMRPGGKLTDKDIDNIKGNKFSILSIPVAKKTADKMKSKAAAIEMAATKVINKYRLCTKRQLMAPDLRGEMEITRIRAYLPTDLHANLKQISKTIQISMSRLVREFL